MKYLSCSSFPELLVLRTFYLILYPLQFTNPVFFFCFFLLSQAIEGYGGYVQFCVWNALVVPF